MKLPTPTKRNAGIAGVLLTVIAGAAGGTVLAVHSAGTSSPPAAVSSPSATPSATPAAGATTPGTGKLPHQKATTARMVVKLTSATATTLTTVDSQGVSATFVLGKHAKVVGPTGSVEQLTSIPAGEILVVQVAHSTQRPASGNSSSSSTSSASSVTTAPAPQLTAVAVEDSGFTAR